MLVYGNFIEMNYAMLDARDIARAIQPAVPCAVCGRPIPRAGNGQSGPWVAGASNAKCPECIAAGRLTEEEAIAKAVRIGDEMRELYSIRIHSYVKRVGIFVAALSLLLLGMLWSYFRFSNGEFTASLLTILLFVGLAAGIGAAVWGHMNDQNRGTRSPEE